MKEGTTNDKWKGEGLFDFKSESPVQLYYQDMIDW